MIHRVIAIMLITLAASATRAGSAAVNGRDHVPKTQTVNAQSTYWGVTVRDPYRWFENPSSPAVQRWIDAQNAYTEKVLARISQGPRLVKRIRQLAITGPQQFGLQLAGTNLFYLRETPPQAQPVLMVSAWPGGTPRVLLDPNPLGGLTAITDVWPSADGRFVAYGTASAGTEDTTIHVIEVGTGRAFENLGDALPRAGGGTTPAWVSWDGDDHGFTYTRLPLRGTVPDSELPFNIALYHHVLGTPASADRLGFGKGLSRVAEYVLLESEDGSRTAAVVHFGDGTNNYVYERSRGGAWRLLARPSDGIESWDNGTVAYVGDRLLAVSVAGTLRGRVVELTNSGLRTIVAQGDRVIRAIVPIAGGFLVTEVWGPDWRIRQFDASGKYIRTVALPPSGISIDGIASVSSSPLAIIDYSGWTMPTRWARYDARTGALTQLYALKAPADYSGVAVARIDAPAPDGAKIPVTLLYKRGLRAAGTAPTILTGYGAYGLTTEPGFVGSGLAWIERGGILAYANIRGGGEFGEGWHKAGALLHEQQRFDDLNTAARALVTAGWTSSTHLGITGGSAGGLLMGGAFTQAPSLYRAIVSFVGPYDALRDELSPNGWMNVTEFGTVTKPDQFKAMYAYSPLERVRNGVAYPAILLITGENDPRVAPWQTWKFGARLQAATSSSNPVVVLTQRQAGHGIGSSFSQRLSNRAAQFVFFAGELGLK